MNAQLPSRWTRLRHHPEQERLWRSKARFKTVSAGRRSGKTEIEGKRRLVIDALEETEVLGARFIAAAPTVAQAKEIFWNDLIALTPGWAVAKINRSELTLEMVNGSRLMVCGLDRPQRIEGSPIRKIVVDEIANCPSDAWAAHIRPALSDPNCLGSASLIGVPEGRNFFYKMVKHAQACTTGEWDHFTWFSADILPPAEIAAAKAGMDPLTYAQEYEGSFITFEGRAYYTFAVANQVPLAYDPKLDLIFCFDFNREPGTASVWQEQERGSCCVGEVWIPQNSNTPAVCNRLIKDWGKDGTDHKGRVKCYGDATGGARGTAKVQGTDWDLISQRLRAAFPGTVQVAGMELHRVSMNVSKRNPPERVRVNAVNSRIEAADGTRRLFIDPKAAPHMVEDLEGVRLLAGGSGEIDKGRHKRSGGVRNEMLTHLSDGAGYYMEKVHTVQDGKRGGVIRHG